MQQKVKKKKRVLILKRYDHSADKSLRPHSSADEFLLEHMNDLSTRPNHLAIYNDRFGFLSCHLNSYKPTVIITTKSQEKAIELNLKTNKLPVLNYSDPISSTEKKIDYAIIKAPKSLGLFQVFIEHIYQNSNQSLSVVIAFMTRHFSPKLLVISEKYFEDVQQSKATKKARLLTLKRKKEVIKLDIIKTLKYKETDYNQFLGVFSAKNIDYATQFFLDHVQLKSNDRCILDLASGNGVIGNEILKKSPQIEVHFLDDFFLAVESAKLNVNGKNVHHHFDNNLSSFKDSTFDLIVSNPPFHFEYEVNIQIAIKLFNECHRCLKTNGNLQIVASNHLNYLTHLKPIYKTVEVLSKNEKFIVYKCVK